MIFLATSAVCWESRCHRYLLAAQPSGKVSIDYRCSINGVVQMAIADSLGEAARFCIAREKRIVRAA